MYRLTTHFTNISGSAIPWLVKACVAATLMGLSLGALSQPEGSPAFRSCMDNVDMSALKKTQWLACSSQEIKRQDAVLNAEYTRLKNALAPEQRAALIKAQRSWLRFRQDWCQLEAISDSAPGGEVNRQFCVIDLTDRQIQVLRTIR